MKVFPRQLSSWPFMNPPREGWRGRSGVFVQHSYDLFFLGSACRSSGESRACLGQPRDDELDVKGTLRCANTFDTAIGLLSKGFIRAYLIIAHRFILENVVEAFDAALNGDTLKVLERQFD